MEILVIENVAGTLDADLDTLMIAVEAAISLDTTLDGSVDLVWVDQPTDITVVPMGGGAPAKGCSIPVTLQYSTTNPLN